MCMCVGLTKGSQRAKQYCVNLTMTMSTKHTHTQNWNNNTTMTRTAINRSYPHFSINEACKNKVQTQLQFFFHHWNFIEVYSTCLKKRLWLIKLINLRQSTSLVWPIRWQLSHSCLCFQCTHHTNKLLQHEQAALVQVRRDRCRERERGNDKDKERKSRWYL